MIQMPVQPPAYQPGEAIEYRDQESNEPDLAAGLTLAEKLVASIAIAQYRKQQKGAA